MLQRSSLNKHRWLTERVRAKKIRKKEVLLMCKEEMFKNLCEYALNAGAYRASIIDASQIVAERAFRQMCEQNACGMYGKCYMCPPDVGDIEVMMQELKKYRYALVYQTVTELEDSFDFEGMTEAKKKTYPIAQGIRNELDKLNVKNVLHLGAGGCGMCERCNKQAGIPCAFPEKALPSLEAYGINVSSLARTADMKYINGQNTVTYFGAALFTLDGE
jgi:predicted metal-binding protein